MRHGTSYRYNAGCRCAVCVEAARARSSAYRVRTGDENRVVMRWWPIDPPLSLYVCGCGFQQAVTFSLTFERVPHRCRLAA